MWCKLEKRKLDFFYYSFINNKVSASYLKKYNPIEINFGRLFTELKILKIKKFNSIIMIDWIKEAKLKEISPDINSLKLI